MEKIVIYDLSPMETKTFIDDLETLELGTVLGGNFWGAYPNVFINTVFDGINTISTTYEGPGSFHDNKINTVDYSRTANVWVSR